MKKKKEKTPDGDLAAVVIRGFEAIDKRFESMATKKDLESVASKKDLTLMATKKDLESVATKKDLESMATKEDIEDLAVMVARGFNDVTGRLDKVEGDVDKLKYHMERKFEDLEFKISSYASGWTKDSESLHEWVGELDSRVNKIEDKIISVK